ncbi:unnamed protein product [Camellia sinensis]
MGKVAAAEMMKKKKKKGRPSLSDLRKRNPKQQQQTLIDSFPNFNTPNNPRSTRRNPNLNGISSASDDGDDDDDERKEKKVKLVVRLPHSDHHFPHPRSSSNFVSVNSTSDSNADGEKPKINATGDRSMDLVASDQQIEMVEKATDTIHGSPMESGPTTPLPQKKLLLFILDRLQKKDIYRVFSEPADPNELPDYHEIIQRPMDFGTVRRKLDEGCYSNLDKFEADVFLICSNAMEYNAPDTIYFRQARSIQELAKRDFENLRQVNDDGEPQPKVVRRGRPPGKNLKSSLGSPPFERVGLESSSDATLATGGENAIGSNSYNLRRVPPVPFRFRSNDSFFRASHQSRNNDTYVDSLSEWNSEFPASVLKAEAKYGKKQFSLDENRRGTYQQFHPSAFGDEPSVLTIFNGDMKQLMGVGLHSEHGYARSLARFAANLGPDVWKFTSKKIQRVLPTGAKFGPGWVGENEASAQPLSALPEQNSSNNAVHDGHPLSAISGTNSVVTYRSSLSSKGEMVEAVSGQNSNSNLAVLKSGSDRNGFNSGSGHDLSPQTGTIPVRLSMPTGQSGLEEALVQSQMLGVVSRSNTSSTPMAANHIISEPKLPGSSRSTHNENVSSQHRQYSLQVQPDLNVRFQTPGSPSSSSFRIGSPQQPDLALQL